MNRIGIQELARIATRRPFLVDHYEHVDDQRHDHDREGHAGDLERGRRVRKQATECLLADFIAGNEHEPGDAERAEGLDLPVAVGMAFIGFFGGKT